MKLVTGAGGFVGKRIMRLCKDTIACPSLRNVSEEDVLRIVEESGCDTIIHTAAISDIGVCQADPDASYGANVLLPLYLAKAARGRKLICFSSDQVYSALEADGPYGENLVKAEHVYGRHKIEMEQRVLDVEPESVMLRAEWMYDYCQEKPNYFMNVLNARQPLSFSSRQYRGVTYVKEVVQNMENVCRLPGGVYNFGSETTQSMYDLTREFLKLLGKDIPVEDGPARHNLWMNCEKARKYGVDFHSVEDGLLACARDYHIIP